MLQNQTRQPIHPLQRQMMFRGRMTGKPGMMNQQAGAATGMNPMVQQSPGKMMQTPQQGNIPGNNQAQGMMNQQNPNMGMGQQNPNVMQQQQQQQQTILPGPSSGGILPQNNVVPNMMVNQNVNQQPQQAQMMGNTINQQQGMMQQNVGNQMGNMPNQMTPAATNQNQNQNMFPNQYQNMNQNFAYNNPNMGGNQANVQGQNQNAMMGNFPQTNPIAGQQQQRIPNADYLAQQRSQFIQQQQQNRQQQQQQQTPNVTMNTNMAVGPQGSVPPPYRQGGKPMVNPNTQQFQEMRRQMMMKQQQQQQGRDLL